MPENARFCPGVAHGFPPETAENAKIDTRVATQILAREA
nr:MAG TPA: hypothetical protein [Caudoviricetes sp.]